MFVVISVILRMIFAAYSTDAWRPYAEPLQLPTAPYLERYEFDLKIEWKLTMSYDEEFGLIPSMVDYFPSEQRWYERDKEAIECDQRRPMNDSSHLQRLVQAHGLHRRLIAVNGESPARPIVVPLGAEVIMRVTNALLIEALTIHVHGMDKRNMWFTDGVSFLQQCPITVGTTYAYRFIADTRGTHWYHGHMATDRGEGLVGAFIVIDDDQQQQNLLREYIVMLQELTVGEPADLHYMQRWRVHKWQFGMDNWKQCWTPTKTYDGSGVGGSAAMYALLVNDKGWYNQEAIIERPSTLPLETFRIGIGETIRLRIVNAGAAQPLRLSIENHPMIVVAADGVPIQRIFIDQLIIFPGERYDVLIEGLSVPARKHYYMIVENMEHYDKQWRRIRPFYGLAKLEYDGDGLANATNVVADIDHINDCNYPTRICTVLNCPFRQFPPDFPYKCIGVGELRSLQPTIDRTVISNNPLSANEAYEEYFINMHYDTNVNGWKYRAPKGMPYFNANDENSIAQWCDPNRCASNASRYDTRCECFVHLNVTLGAIVQLTIYNMAVGADSSGFAHPVHIHGTHFYLMKVAYPQYNATSGRIIVSNTDIPCAESNRHCNNLTWTNTNWSNGRVPDMNIIDPSSRDTVVVPMGGYIVVRFRADNPGWWYAHCHVMMHQMGGTAFAMRIGSREQMPAPPDNFPHDCGIYEPNPMKMVSNGM